MELKNTKQSYETPEVKQLGSVEQMTQGLVNDGGSCVGPILTIK